MAIIIQGTTPTLKITVKTTDILLENVADIELTFKQWNGQTVIKRLADLGIDTTNNVIVYHFSEQETLDLLPRTDIEWQLRLKTIGGEIFGTKLSRFDVADLLSEEVM
jgi:hypothetical protein